MVPKGGDRNLLVKLPRNARVNDLFTVAGSQTQIYTSGGTREEVRGMQTAADRGIGKIGRKLLQ